MFRHVFNKRDFYFMSDFVMRWLKLSLVVVVGCGFVAMMVYALWMKEDLQNSSLEPPLVAASDVPLKRRPEEPGGMEIPHQDKMVFDLLDNSTTTVASGTVDVAVVSDSAVETPDALVDEVVTPPEPIAAVVDEEKSAEPVVVAKFEEPKPEPKVEPKPEPKVVAKVEPKVEPKAEPKVVAKGSWGVQVASLGTQADADKAISQFNKNSALRGLTGKVVKATVGGATKYRVQFVGAASRAAAAAVCAKAKVSCMPVEVK